MFLNAMSHPYWLIALVMLAAGVAGGLLSRSFQKNDDPSADTAWWQSLLAGVVASFMVPLFLNMISSNLLESITGPKGDPVEVFVFMGFCLVAAVSANTFIRSLSVKVLSEVRANMKEIRQVRSEVEPLIEKETEKEPEETRPLSVNVADAMHVGDNDLKVLGALANGEFTLRTRTGIATETGIPKELVNNIVEDLATKGLAKKVRVMRHGDSEPKTRWYITQ